MPFLHSEQTDTDGLHEPKGASTATTGQVYISDGAGSGTWTDFPALKFNPVSESPNGVRTDFTLTFEPLFGDSFVWNTGNEYQQADFSIVGTTLTIPVAPLTGDILVVKSTG